MQLADNEFQLSITLLQKAYFLISSLNLLLISHTVHGHQLSTMTERSVPVGVTEDKYQQAALYPDSKFNRSPNN